MRIFKILVFSSIIAGLITVKAHAQMHSTDASHSDHTITILAEDYAFQAPDVIPQGWTTIEFSNEGNEDHFLLIAKPPEGKTFDDYASGVLIPFNDVWYALRDDGISQEDAMGKLGADLPEWFWAVEFIGGTGIIPAGATTQITLNLEPGSYVIECYMKNEDGELHNVEGMMRELTVTESPSEASPPNADIAITLSNFEMMIDGDLKPGKHSFSVHVAEHPEQGFGHNVHVARVAPDTDVREVQRYMNFMEVDGLQTPAPVQFIGGMHIMPQGNTGYFTAELESGRYLFISEYTGHLGVMQDVTIE